MIQEEAPNEDAQGLALPGTKASSVMSVILRDLKRC
jgi:hypothetical protein